MRSRCLVIAWMLLFSGCYSAERGNSIRYVLGTGVADPVDRARSQDNAIAAREPGNETAAVDRKPDKSVPSSTQVLPNAPESQQQPITLDESRTALVIGNRTYISAPLRTPADDGRAIAATLRRLGFDVAFVEDGTRQKMIEAIEGFVAALRNQHGVGLFFYAGHALQIDGQNYLVPTDADINTEMSAKANTVDVDSLLKTMADAKGRISVIILDACRNNPFKSRVRGAAQGLAQVNASGNDMLIEFSTAPGTTASDGDGPHSPYAQALLETMEKPGLSIEQLFKQVRVKVIQATANQQRPWEESSLTGDFRFK